MNYNNPLSRIRKRRQSWLNDFLPEERWIDTIKATSNFLANFDWGRSFWQPTHSSQSLHVLSIQGMDGSCGVAQLWLVGRLEFATLVKKTDYWMVRICITEIDRNKLKTGLKTTGILGDAWSTTWQQLLSSRYSLCRQTPSLSILGSISCRMTTVKPKYCLST